jgi:hypothetical protein
MPAGFSPEFCASIRIRQASSELVVDGDAADADVVLAGREGHIACAGSSQIAIRKRQVAGVGTTEVIEQVFASPFGRLSVSVCRFADALRPSSVFDRADAHQYLEQASKYYLVLNLKTAKALSIELSPTVIGRADEVIE